MRLIRSAGFSNVGKTLSSDYILRQSKGPHLSRRIAMQHICVIALLQMVAQNKACGELHQAKHHLQTTGSQVYTQRSDPL